MSRTFHVAIIAETAHRYGRAVTRGVCAYANEHADWQIDYHPPPPAGRMPASFKHWPGKASHAKFSTCPMATPPGPDTSSAKS